MPTPKMYVLVRNDLSSSYKFVQGAHALAQYSILFPENFSKWNNSTIAFLAVRNYKDLIAIELTLMATKKIFASFREEDLDNQLTSIACYDTGEIFKNLKVA